MERKKHAGGKRAGIRLNHLNTGLICAGLVISALMVVSMYRTTGSVQEIVTMTNNYLSNQQTGGMLQDFAGNLGEQAMSFVQSGEVGPAKSYEAQLNVINAQLAEFDPETFNSGDAGEALLSAIRDFRTRNAIERHAMRLAADGMSQGAFNALPAFLREEELSETEQALSAEEKKAAAVQMLTAEEYTGYTETIRTSVNASHRLSSLAGSEHAKDIFSRVSSIMTGEEVLVFLFIAIAVAALFINRLLIIDPIRKSVGNLDRGEPIPERGSFEMRRLAQAYNEVLKDNAEKEKTLSYTATHDSLTDLLNRAAFDKTFRELGSSQVALLVADVDHFKQYNDEYGHDIGDRVLQMAAEALKGRFRREDQIFRIGGDEFCIIMPGICQNRADSIREKIVQINRELKHAGADLPPITLSAGIACWDRPNPKGTLFKDADRVLLELKKTRETCCAVYQ